MYMSADSYVDAPQIGVGWFWVLALYACFALGVVFMAADVSCDVAVSDGGGNSIGGSAAYSAGCAGMTRRSHPTEATDRRARLLESTEE